MGKVKDYFKHKKGISTFTTRELLTVSFSFAVIASVITAFVVNYYVTNIKTKYADLEDLYQTYDKITNDYYKDVDKDKLVDAAVDGMLSYLDEKYSVYLDTEETDSLTNTLDGTYEGIGIQIKKDGDNIIVANVYDDTPAEKAGLKQNDILIKINKLEVTKDTTTEDVVSNVYDKEENTIVVLRNKKEITFKVSKTSLDVPVVIYELFETEDKKNIGYIYLESFSKTSYVQFTNALNKLENQKIAGLIIDLRNNTGGYLSSATDIASLFLNKNKIIYYLDDKNGKKTPTYDETDEHRTYDITVLINSYSASASEILASALKESYGAIIVGNKSYGKGKVQQTETLSDDTMIKYTTSLWYTPLGNNIDEKGIVPGVSVNLSKKYYKNPSIETDNQIQKCLEIISENN